MLGAGVGATRRERRFQEVAHTNRGPGFWLGGIAGNTVRTGGQAVSTLVYGIAAVEYVDEIACLSGGSCQMKLAAGGGVYQRRRAPTGDADPEHARRGRGRRLRLDGRVRARCRQSVRKARPIAAADLPIEIVDADTGDVDRARHARGNAARDRARAPRARHARAYARRTEARVVLGDETGHRTRLGRRPGRRRRKSVSANDQIAVFRVGRFLHVLTFATGHSRTVAETVGRPIGVSLEGSRLAWAENVNGRGRIRALYVNGRG